jgi:hypothetical protein
MHHHTSFDMFENALLAAQKLDENLQAGTAADPDRLPSEEANDVLRKSLEHYFQAPAEEGASAPPPDPEPIPSRVAVALKIDLRDLFQEQPPEIGLTARSAARILQGISSPRFPTTTWMRHRLWGRHSLMDFPALYNLAAETFSALAPKEEDSYS